MPPVPFWWPSLTRDRMSPAVCEIANCRTGVSARTPADTRMTATASTAPARSPAGCCGSRSLPGPATRKCSLTAPRTPWSHADIASSPLSARLAPAEYPAIIQATSSGRGVVSRARIRSRPSSAGLYRAGGCPQRAAQNLLKVTIALGHFRFSSRTRSDDMARAVWLLTAPVLIPIVWAICLCDRSP